MIQHVISLMKYRIEFYEWSFGTKCWTCSLMKVPMVTTESGLQYKDIKVGEGPSPPVGFQVCKLVWLTYKWIFYFSFIFPAKALDNDPKYKLLSSYRKVYKLVSGLRIVVFICYSNWAWDFYVKWTS